MGTKRDAYVEKLKGNITKWNTEIDELQAKADQAKADAKAEFHKHVVDLKAKRLALEEKIKELNNAKDEAWEDVKSGVDVSRQILGQAIQDAKSRFA